MGRETKRYDVRAINQDGYEIQMQVVERDGRLILWNGLDQRPLMAELGEPVGSIEAEIKQLTGVSRVVVF